MPTPKPVRKAMKKMAAESREASKTQHSGVKNKAKELVVKHFKEKGAKKRTINFIKSQY